jgi:hypothetical protein
MIANHAIVKEEIVIMVMYNWIGLFVSMYNNTIVAKNNPVQIIKEVVVVFS